MKIIFICGSLEPGQDGVGDYTRRLAGELNTQGQTTSIISLYEIHLTEFLKEVQDAAGESISVLRIPYDTTYKQRLILVNNFIGEFDPDWISLQFVPFSFHNKGLPLKLVPFLKEIGKGKKWHLMFHELWVGMNIGSPSFIYWWGQLQKIIIKYLLFTLKPQMVHTSTYIYQKQLINLGYKAERLPIFSNILNNHNDFINKRKSNKFHLNNNEISLVMFGSIHPGAPIKKFAIEISKVKKHKSTKVNLTIIGRSGEIRKQWVTMFRSLGIKVNLYGELPPKDISNILNNSSIGITTTPISLVEKSGTIAAMQEHGLPILCVSSPWQTKGIKIFQPPIGIYEYEANKLDLLSLFNLKNICSAHSAGNVAEKFINSLENQKLQQ